MLLYYVEIKEVSSIDGGQLKCISIDIHLPLILFYNVYVTTVYSYNSTTPL
jgi:hypothetical protein